MRVRGVAGMAGIEPARAESKSAVLPLDYTPVFHPPAAGFLVRKRDTQRVCPFSCGVEDGTRTHGLQCHKLAL